MRRLLIWLLACGAICRAQTATYLYGAAASRPATCLAGQMYVATDVGGSGGLISYCTSGGAWVTALSNGSLALANLSDGAGVVKGAAGLTTAGNIPYISGAGTLNQDGTTRLCWDSTNHYLGIATCSPGYFLHVKALSGEGDPQSANGEVVRLQRNNASNTSASMGIVAGSAGNAGVFLGDNSSAAQGYFVYSNSDDSVRIGANGNEALRITSSSKVEVGQSNPNASTVPQAAFTAWGGDLDVANPSTVGTESFSNGALTSGTGWTVTGDFALASNAAAYTHSTAAGTLNQASGTLAMAGVANQWYMLAYTVSGVSAGVACNVTTGFAAAVTSLNLTAGTQTTYIRTGTSPGNFSISCTSTAGAVTLDDLSLKAVTGGALRAPGGAVLGPSTISQTGLGTTPAAGVSLINPTPAAAGAQQYPPSVIWTGQGYKTDATAASQPVAFRSYVQPVQGAAAPTGNWMLDSSINGGAYSNVLAVTSGGNVGIGTTNPLYRLQVRSASGSSGNTMFSTSDYVQSTTGSGVGISFGATSGNTYTQIQGFTSGGAGQGNLIINSSGNVGIGSTASPTGTRLLVSTGSDAAKGVIVKANSATQSANLQEWQASDGTVLHVVDSSGKVGIGTAAPTTPLQIGAGSGTLGTLHVGNTGADALITVERASGAKLFLYSHSSSNEIGSVAAYPLLFTTNNAYRMAITSAGLVGVGTTFPTGAPAKALTRSSTMDWAVSC